MNSAGELMLAALSLPGRRVCASAMERREEKQQGPGQGIVDLCCFEKYFRNEKHVLLSKVLPKT